MLLEDAGESGDLARALHGVLGEGRALLAVVEESLAPARVEAGGVDVARLAAEIAPALDRLDQAVGRLLGLAAGSDDRAVSADAERIAGAVARLGVLVADWGARPAPSGGAAPAAAAPRQATAPAASGAAPGARRPRRPRSSSSTTTRRTATCSPGASRREGHHTLAADGGRRPSRSCGDEPVDLVLLDVMMPDLDGYDRAASASRPTRRCATSRC